MCPRKVIISTFGRDLANDVAKYNHVLSTARRAVCTFPTFYCPKVSRFDVSCNRPLRFSRAVGDNWRYHRRNISERPACNSCCHSTYQNRSLNWFNCRFYPWEKPLRIFGNLLKPPAVNSYRIFFFASFIRYQSRTQNANTSQTEYSRDSRFQL